MYRGRPIPAPGFSHAPTGLRPSPPRRLHLNQRPSPPRRLHLNQRPFPPRPQDFFPSPAGRSSPPGRLHLSQRPSLPQPEPDAAALVLRTYDVRFIILFVFCPKFDNFFVFLVFFFHILHFSC